MFTEEQKAVIDHTTGPALVVASPGSGKSTVVVERAIKLVESGVKAKRILLTTFSSAAKDDLNAKLQKRKLGTEVEARTVHSLGFEILRAHYALAGKKAGIQIESSKEYQIKKLLGPRDEKFNPKGMDWEDADLQFVCSAISYMKRNYIKPPEAEQFLEDNDTPFAPRVAQAYRIYENHLTYKNAVDFDDMLMLSSWVLENNPDISRRWSQKYDFVSMDECQDSNLLQYTLVKHLAQHGNILWVGDDFQSIYGFTGAIPQDTVYSFQDNYPEGKVYILPHNFRSQSNIIKASNELVKHMHNPFEKEAKATRAQGEEIVVNCLQDTVEEAEWVVDDIRNTEAGQEDFNWSETAVIYRTNRQSRLIEDKLIRARIPYVIFGSVSFYGRKVVKDMVAYIRLAFRDHGTDDDFKRVINIPSTRFGKPTRYLGKKFVETIEREASNSKTAMWATARRSPSVRPLQKCGVSDLAYMVKAVRDADSLAEGLQWVLENGYADYIRKEYGEMDKEGESRLETLEELIKASSEFASPEAFLVHLDNIDQIEAEKQDGNYNGVNLLTIHRSKGLEWENVYLVGCTQGQLPLLVTNGLSVGEVDSEKEMQEERRLAYVAVTRAKDNVSMTYSSLNHKSQQVDPSQFLIEMGLA